MKLLPGERLPASGPPNQPGGYLVTEVISETAWYGLYGARKICYNFDFTAKRPRETEEKEWLDVLLRTVNYPRLDSPEYVTGRRALARAAGTTVLTDRTSNLWPEPLDLLELANTRDPFAFGQDARARRTVLGSADPLAREPVVVLARPHGEPLARWLHTDPSAGAVLSVAAELLDFVRAAHADGLLLNGLSPSAVLVDRAGRTHYLGTDAAVPFHLAPGTPAWRPFFPPERYPRGYSAPECFVPGAVCDRRADLYAWAALAYQLFTGDRPVQLALEQGRPWAHFGEPQWERLTQALHAIPTTHVRHWAEQLGVAEAAFLAGWPANLVAVLRLSLSPEPYRRPGTADDLRAWLLAPPPPPPTAALALRLPRSDSVRLFCAAPDGAADVVVRRGTGQAPATADEGAAVAEVAPGHWAEDTCPRAPCPTGVADDLLNPAGDSARYACFARRRHGTATICSTGTPAYLLEPFPVNIRRLAEGGAAVGGLDEPEPARVALLFQALDAARTAETLLGSALPQVRVWALRRLASARRQPGASASLDTLLLRSLQDPVQALRLEAVCGLLTGSADPTEALVRRVFAMLAASHPEDCAPAARLLRQAGFREEVLRLALAAVGQDVPIACPVCAVEIPDRDLPAHLVGRHGYLEVAGEVVPRPEGLARLWERVFASGDRTAHDQLWGLLRANSGPGYAAALEAEIGRRADALLVQQAECVSRLAGCLRRNREVRALLPELLRSADPKTRQVGRQLLLPELGDRLAGEKVSVADLRRQLEGLCPGAGIDEKILLCQELGPLGIAAAAVEGCVRELQAQRPVVCSECGQAVPQADHDAHLRGVHRIHEFRGVRRSLEETVAVLLDALASASPDYEAWAALERATRDEHGDRADALLAAWLVQKVSGTAATERGQVAGAMAEAIARDGSASRLVPALAATGGTQALQVSAILLALEVVARAAPPLPGQAVEAVKPLLADRRLPRETRDAATAALLRTAGKTGPAARGVLQVYIAGVAKTVAIERLHRLEGRVGQAEAIDDLCAELEDQIRMSCPRCRVELVRPEMAEHVWREHRLMLDGRRVREPWRVLGDWIEDYKLEKDADVLHRCRELALRLDPKRGPLELQRLLLRQGVDDADARKALGAEARRQGASLCPRCYGPVPPRGFEPPAAVYVGKRGLSSGGYRVEVRDGGLRYRLDVKGPTGWIYRGREPGRWWTRKGAWLLLTLPWFVAAGVLAYLQPALLDPAWELPPWTPAAAAGGLGLLLALVVPLLWRPPSDPRPRAVNHAWAVLGPRLHRGGFTPEGLALAAGLAEASRDRGDAVARGAPLHAACAAADETACSDSARSLCAGILARFAAEECGRRGEDPVPELADRLVRCVAGELPLGYAAALLGTAEATVWTPGQRRRLSVLLCARAFEAGLGPLDLAEAGRGCDVLGALLPSTDPAALARLLALWSLGDARPRGAAGEAASVFELADRPGEGEALLAEFPDLLLAPPGGEGPCVTARGVCLAGVFFAEEPRRIEVQQREGGFVLTVGRHRFRFEDDPTGVAERLRGWLPWYFREFLPRVPPASEWRAPQATQQRAARNAVACPECRCLLVPCVGAVGIAVEEGAAIPAAHE
ncbi:MAG: hypothetical protein IT429_18260 [Gemmataceae bacterium]|nr:hypothetical protein [Gemmataceae bacterium]